MTKEDVYYIKIVNCIFQNKASIKVDIYIHRKMTNTLRNTIKPIFSLVFFNARENILQKIYPTHELHRRVLQDE